MRTKPNSQGVDFSTLTLTHVARFFCSIAVVISVAGCATPTQTTATKTDPLLDSLARDADDVAASFKLMADAQTKPNRTVSFAEPQPAADSYRTDSHAAEMAPVMTSSPAIDSSPSSVAFRSGPMTMPAGYAAPSVNSVSSETVHAEMVRPVILMGTGIVVNAPPSPPPGLDQKYAINGTGDIQELIQNICTATGWARGADSGTRIRPVRVSLSMTDSSAYEVLRSAAAFTQNQVDVVVEPDRRAISLHYTLNTIK